MHGFNDKIRNCILAFFPINNSNIIRHDTILVIILLKEAIKHYRSAYSYRKCFIVGYYHTLIHYIFLLHACIHLNSPSIWRKIMFMSKSDKNECILHTENPIRVTKRIQAVQQQKHHHYSIPIKNGMNDIHESMSIFASRFYLINRP